MNPKERAERDDFRKALKGWVDANCPDWTEEPVIVEWFAKSKSPRTLKNWREQFWMFIGYAKMTPTQLMEKREADASSKDKKIKFFFEGKVAEFARDLARHHYGEKTVRSYVSRVQAFFAQHRTRLEFTKGELKITETAAAKSDRRSKRFVKREAASINMDVRLMYNVAGPEDRVLLMFGYQYGFLPKDISMVRADDLPVGLDTPEDEFIYWETARAKTGEDVWTALNPEIVHDIKSLLRIRSVEAEALKARGKDDPGWLFITSRGNRLREDHVSARLKSLAAKAFDEEKAADFAAKDLRDAFNVSLIESKLPPEVKDKLYGHKLAGSRGSYEISPKAVIEGYQKVFKLVSLNSWKQRRRDDSERMEFFELALGIILKTNPEAIEAIEKMARKEPGYTTEMLKSEAKQLFDRLFYRLSKRA